GRRPHLPPKEQVHPERRERHRQRDPDVVGLDFRQEQPDRQRRQGKQLVERVVHRRLAVRGGRIPERKRAGLERVPQEQEPRPERHRQVADEEQPRTREDAVDGNHRDGHGKQWPYERRKTEEGLYWRVWPPDGADWSLPLAPIELVICHSVPVV